MAEGWAAQAQTFHNPDNGRMLGTRLFCNPQFVAESVKPLAAPLGPAWAVEGRSKGVKDVPAAGAKTGVIHAPLTTPAAMWVLRINHAEIPLGFS